jgi:TRAP-type C4-dicarboxylate transport system permease small subunit
MSISENWPSPENEGSSPAKSFVVTAAHSIENWIGQLCRVILLVTGLFLLGILTLIVALRYWGGGSIDSGSELTALVFPVFVMAGIVEAARMGAHVATQLLLHALKNQWRIRLVVLIHSVTAVVYLYLAWYALLNAIIAHDELSTTLKVPGSVGYGCLAIGLAFVGICSLTTIVRHTVGKEEVLVNLSDAGPGVV